MLNRTNPSVYNKTAKEEVLWKQQGYVLFVRLKNHMKNLARAKKGKTVMQNNAKFAVWPRDASITKSALTFALLNMKDGRKEILTKFLRIKELIITGIKKKSWKSLENQEKSMDILTQKIIENETKKKSHAIIMWPWRLVLVILFAQIYVNDVVFNVSHMLITMTTRSRWMLNGFAENVMEKSIEPFCQRERLNLWTPKGDAIVQTTEETCRGEFEAVPPPRNRSVSKLLLKVIDRLRHTAGCSFYQGQCITNDLWVQNLRSTGI